MSNFKAWAKDVALRAVKTAAQAAGAVITANTAGLTHVPFGTVADVAGLAALICVLQNLSNLKVPTSSDALAVDFFKSVDRSAPRVGNSATGVNRTVTTSSGPPPDAGTANITFPYVPPAVAPDPTQPAASS